MKKIITLTLSILMIFALAACGGGGDTVVPEEPPEEEETAPAPAPPVQEEIEGEFFPGLSDNEIPEVLKRKAGQVESATKEPSDDPAFSYEIVIILAGCPMNFYSILSDHYNQEAITSELPLDESLERFYTFDWGEITLSSKQMLIEEDLIKIIARVF